jgi:hypothetical protein
MKGLLFMAKADSVLSTPPTKTSPNKRSKDRRKPQDSLYRKTPVTPEEAFQAIGRLRKEARDEMELADNVDDGDDDNELDGPEKGEDEESDP